MPFFGKEATKETIWEYTMNDELFSIEKNRTWELVSPLKNYKPSELKWVFKVKRSPNEEILWHKARLVLKGYA